VNAILQEIEKLPGQAEFARRTREQFDAYYAPASTVARIMLGIEKGDAKASVEGMQAAIRVLNQEIEGATQRAGAGFDASLGAAQANIRHVLVSMVAAGVLVVLALVLVSWLIVRAIWRQLGGEPEYARRIVREIARGNLAMRIEREPGDKTSQLAALRDMQSAVAELISNIRTSAGSVRHTAGEIAAGMTELSARTEEQASSLEETASSMEELTATVKRNAEHAVHARELARGSSESQRAAAQGAGSRRHDGRDRAQLRRDRQHRLGDRRDRVPDQHPRPQRRGGSRPRGRAGPRLRRRRRRGPQPRPAQRRVGARDQGPHRCVGGEGRRGTPPGLRGGATMKQVVDSINEVAGVVTEISRPRSSNRPASRRWAAP
jgi:methyl-accepting chemotaxis protein